MLKRLSSSLTQAVVYLTLNLNRDIATGILFVVGLWGFISGQFIISTVLFLS
jgi:hypothetical protein